MRVLVVSSSALCCLLLLAVSEANSNYDNNYGANYNHAELVNLGRFVYRVADENNQVKKRLHVLKAQKAKLLDRLAEVLNTTIPGFNAVQADQDAQLVAIKKVIKKALHSVDEKEALLAGEARVTKRQHDTHEFRWPRIDQIVKSDDEQDALLAQIQFLLQEVREKVESKLLANENDAKDKVQELGANAEALVDLINSKKCYQTSAHVALNDTGKKTVYFPADFFHGPTPTAYCALTGFSSRLTLESYSAAGYGNAGGYGQNAYNSKAGGYGQNSYNSYNAYEEELAEVLAVTVDCKPYADHVEVTAIDGSRGGYNSVDNVYIDIVLCTMGPLAGV